MAKRNEFSDSPVWRKASSSVPEGLKANSTDTSNYRGVMEVNGAPLAQQQTGQVRLPGVTGNNPAPTAVNNNGADLASVSVNVMGGQGTLPPSMHCRP